MKFRANSTVKEIRETFGREMFSYLIYDQAKGGAGNFGSDSVTLSDIQTRNPTWEVRDMVYGLNRLKELSESGEKILYSVYDKELTMGCPQKEAVKLIFFPACKTGGKEERRRRRSENRYAILAAGGGYGAVCSMTEAFPVMAKLNELGISAFCLNYRVGAPETSDPLFPKPMEDLAAACRLIQENAEIFEVDPKRYAVGGFSAGGHLAASWGLWEWGAKQAGCFGPTLLMLVYPLLCLYDTMSVYPEPLRSMMLEAYLGKEHGPGACLPYEILEQMDGSYPPVYLVQAEDDPTVPIWNSERMRNKMEALSLPCLYERLRCGGHGFGLGSATEGAGWVERAVAFWDERERSGSGDELIR